MARGIDVEAGSINVNGQSTLVADGGEGHSAGGSGVLSLLASGNIALAATQGGIGAFGGNGGTTGGNAQTTITSSGGSISVENMRNSVSSFFGGRSGRGVFAHGGNALHPLQTAAGGVGSLLIATDGTGSISSTASHIDAVGGSALGTGGKGEILVQSNGGNVSITNGYENDFFPGPPQLGNTLGAMGGDGGAKGGAATTTVITVGGSIAVADDVVGAVGGNSEGIGGAATLTMGAGGAINISASNVGALGGFGSAGGGKATVGFVAGGDITIQGPSPLIQNTAAYGAIGGNAGSGNGGDAEVTFQSLGGNVTVSHDNVAVAGGNSTGGGTGGLAKLTVDAAGGIFFHESHIVAIAGGGAIGGAAAINLRAGQRIEIIGASQGGTTPGNSLLAIGGAGQSAEGLGAAEIFMEVTSPTGEIVVVNDLVHAQGGRLGESEVFGPARITLSFPTRTEGGFSVDGVDGATIGSLPAGCASISAPACLPHGFVVNNGLEPTTLDLNFFVDYGSPPQDERFQAQIIDAIARILDTGSNPVEEDVGDSDDEKAKKGKAVCN